MAHNVGRLDQIVVDLENRAGPVTFSIALRR